MTINVMERKTLLSFKSRFCLSLLFLVLCLDASVALASRTKATAKAAQAQRIGTTKVEVPPTKFEDESASESVSPRSEELSQQQSQQQSVECDVGEWLNFGARLTADQRKVWEDRASGLGLQFADFVDIPEDKPDWFSSLSMYRLLINLDYWCYQWVYQYRDIISRDGEWIERPAESGSDKKAETAAQVDKLLADYLEAKHDVCLVPVIACMNSAINHGHTPLGEKEKNYIKWRLEWINDVVFPKDVSFDWQGEFKEVFKMMEGADLQDSGGSSEAVMDTAGKEVVTEGEDNEEEDIPLDYSSITTCQSEADLKEAIKKSPHSYYLKLHANAEYYKKKLKLCMFWDAVYTYFDDAHKSDPLKQLYFNIVLKLGLHRQKCLQPEEKLLVVVWHQRRLIIKKHKSRKTNWLEKVETFDLSALGKAPSAPIVVRQKHKPVSPLAVSSTQEVTGNQGAGEDSQLKAALLAGVVARSPFMTVKTASPPLPGHMSHDQRAMKRGFDDRDQGVPQVVPKFPGTLTTPVTKAMRLSPAMSGGHPYSYTTASPLPCGRGFSQPQMMIHGYPPGPGSSGYISMSPYGGPPHHMSVYPAESSTNHVQFDNWGGRGTTGGPGYVYPQQFPPPPAYGNHGYR